MYARTCTVQPLLDPANAPRPHPSGSTTPVLVSKRWQRLRKSFYTEISCCRSFHFLHLGTLWLPMKGRGKTHNQSLVTHDVLAHELPHTHTHARTHTHASSHVDQRSWFPSRTFPAPMMLSSRGLFCSKLILHATGKRDPLPALL